MITIIHGDNIVMSRKKLSALTTNSTNTENYNAKKDSVEKITNELSGQSLFEEKKTVVIENLKAPGLKKYNELIKSINKYKDDSKTHVIVYLETTEKAPFLKKFHTKSVETFALPKYFFTFLDGIYPKNAKNVLTIKQKMSDSFADEQLFYAVVKRVRLLLMAKTGKINMLTEGKKMGAWQQERLLSQSSKWDNKALIHFYTDLSKLEFGLKTSGLAQSLGEHLDIVLFKTLK